MHDIPTHEKTDIPARENSAGGRSEIRSRNRPGRGTVSEDVRGSEASPNGRDARSDDPWVEGAVIEGVEESLVTSKQVRARIGGVSAMCVWRWTRDGKFPAPIRINGRNYWRSGLIRAWISAQGSGE